MKRPVGFDVQIKAFIITWIEDFIQIAEKETKHYHLEREMMYICTVIPPKKLKTIAEEDKMRKVILFTRIDGTEKVTFIYKQK